MSLSLSDVLADVDLAPGQTYECSVRGKGYRVILQVIAESPVSTPHTSDWDVPFDDPFDHPFPVPALHTTATLGSLPLPDPLVLSAEDYEESAT